eukprot:TRINITY_DN12149_c0_g1_i1.p1 TRINITY_DN12149_c0_g1~~TRINITY_DN12149_c0_g1_i1.p1  ORF type:complete len:240 (+),score=61.52 TRINITY_DN12149_c0_g1_i1:128-847(+)
MLHLVKITAEIYQEDNNDEEALLVYLEADEYSKPKAVYKDSIVHLVICTIYERMAEIYLKKKDYANAIKRLKVIEKFLRDRFGSGSPMLFRVYHQLFKTYRAAGDKTNQSEFKEKLLKLIIAPPGRTQLNLAPEYLKLTDSEFLEAAVKGKSRKDLWDCPEMGDVYVKYAKICKDGEDNVGVLKNALEVFKNVYGRVHGKVAEVYKLLAEAVMDSDSKEAKEYAAAANGIESELNEDYK